MKSAIISPLNLVPASPSPGRRLPLLPIAATILMLAATCSAQLFSDDFDSYVSPSVVTASGTANGYSIQYNAAAGAENFRAVFGFDYSTFAYPLPIPSAPNSVGGTTKGLFLTLNKNAALPGGAATGGNAAAVN